jgi:outer membrane lipoprotein SlyB
MTATFEYTLVAADGRRSAPFQRTFDIVAPLVITAVNVPRPLRVGNAFAVGIGYQKSSAEIVSVERKVIESTVPWAQNERALAVKLNNESGRFDYNFEPIPKPTRATVEFTLVDAAGLRSDPVRVTLDVGVATPALPGTGPGTVTAINLAQATGAAPQKRTGVGAVLGGILGGILGNKVGGGTGRTVTTVAGVAGGAWAGNEVEKKVGSQGSGATAAQFDTTVRFDSGQTRVIRTMGNPQWQVGSRVVFDGRVLSPETR